MRLTLQSAARVVLPLLLLVPSAFAAKQVATEHYVVVFEEDYEYWAHEVIKVAEEVWDNLAVAYESMDEFKRIYIYIEDPGDYATGFTLPSRNRVTVGVTALEIGIRSSDNWIRNVVTHELAHVFSIKAANKDFPLKNWWVGRSSQYQNPDVNVAFHYRNLLAPQWFVEGVAQHGALKNGNDRWDTHRDMFLRMAVLEDDLLDYSEMSVFTSRHGFYPEMTYNQGFSMVRFIDSVYGEEAVYRTAKNPSLAHFSHSLRKGTGLNGPQLYNQWKQAAQDQYRPVADKVNKDLREGTLLLDEGYWDFHGAYSPDGRKIALISNKGYDVLYPHVFTYDPATGDLDKVRRRLTGRATTQHVPGAYRYEPGSMPAPARLGPPDLSPARAWDDHTTGPSSQTMPVVYSRISWSPDGRRLCYAHAGAHSSYRDVFVYDINTRYEQRLTWHARAKDPSFSPDGNTIAYIQNDKGSQNLMLVDATGKSPRKLTNFNNGTQLFAPCWTPDGSKLVFGILQGTDRNIAIARTDARPFDRLEVLEDSTLYPDSVNYNEDLELLLLVHTDADERDPCISPDGEYVYYSSDRTGIFNIYRMSLRTWGVEQITNVLGGAFAPSVHPDGSRVLYTGYHAANYSLYEIQTGSPPKVELTYTPRSYLERFTDDLLFSGSPEVGQYRLGEYKPRFTLWWLEPYLSWQPTYITDTVGISQMRLGASMVAGELRGNMSMSGSAFISKDFDNGAGPSWGADLVMALKAPNVFGENRDFTPQAFAFGSHEVVRGEDALTADIDPDKTDFTRTPPNDYSIFIEPDTLIGVYYDFAGGVFSDERVFNQYGVVGNLQFDRYNNIGVYYSRLDDRYTANYLDYSLSWQGRVLLSDDRFSNVVDMSDTTLSDPFAQAAIGWWQNWADTAVSDTSPATDIYDLYDEFGIYSDHRVGLNYSFTNIRPDFFVPCRVDFAAIGLQFVRSTLTVDSYGDGGTDTLIERETANDLLLNFGPEGQQIPSYTPIQQQKDFLTVEASVYERFPLPGHHQLQALPKGLRSGHFLSGQLFFGSVSRKLPAEASTYPLEYRVAHFLKAYPYSFNPVDIGRVEGAFAVDRYDTQLNLIGADSIHYALEGDTSVGDIMWGNGILYGSLEYTLELFRGLSSSSAGMLVEGLYVTPFFEIASIWNEDWAHFPLRRTDDGHLTWEADYFRDIGVRTELVFQWAHHWHGLLTFTWARRLDLDDAVLRYEREGNRVTKTYLDKDRFSLTLHLW